MIRISSLITTVLFSLVLPCFSDVSAQISGPPKAKNSLKVTKLADLGLADAWIQDATTLGISIVNSYTDAGPFTVRIWVKYKKAAKKVFYEKRVKLVGTVESHPVLFDSLRPLDGAEIGVFIDSQKEVLEKDERNCARIYADGGMVGKLSCNDFSKEVTK